VDFLISTIFSLHLGVTQVDNSIHPNISLSKNDLTGGLYYNTDKSISSYFGKIFRKDKLEIFVGGVTGYKLPIDSPVAPMVLARYEIDKNINVIAMPTIDNKTRNPALVFGIELVFHK
jgi:hypothetical protein